MKILIDADGCPVVNQALKIAQQYNIDCKIICDTAHIINKEGAETITITKGSDSVDFALVNMIKKSDIVITQDYGLAAMSLAMLANVINQDGFVYTAQNIDMLLFQRHISKKIRQAGGKIRGNNKRKSKQNTSFEKTLINILDTIKN